MSKKTITESQVLDAWEDMIGVLKIGDGQTTAEIAEQTGCSEKTVLKRLKALIATGKAECVRTSRKTIDGRNGLVPAYRLVEKASNK